MVKRILLVLCFVFFAGFVYAGTGGESQTVYSVELKNDTGTFADFLIPVTTIRPDVDKLWGYDTISIAGQGNSEVWISIFDSTDSTMSGECFGEQESNDNWSIHDRWTRGKKIVNGVAVRVGAYTDTQIFFIRE